MKNYKPTIGLESRKNYKPTIGIEVHAELKTKSKMFCGCKNDPHDSEVNAHTCPVCLAHPGTLPTVNKEAVKKLLMVGNAIDGNIATYSEFDRKNYFYPDIPKAYQLSQYKFAFVKGGSLAGVAINRIHLEEDTARSQHDGNESVVNFNRAGVPLMELVTEPVIHDAETAGQFVRELQLLLKTIGVSDANMERGEMRVEANISISADDQMSDKYVEVKNLNSFKAMESAIVYEIKRQAEVLDAGDQIVQETRGWDENKSKTFSQRSKEQAEEYRYFPDPDIPKMDIRSVAAFDNSRLKEIMPIIPSKKRVLYNNLGLKSNQTEVIIANPQIDAYFCSVMDTEEFNPAYALTASNYLTSDLVSLLGEKDSPDLSPESASNFAKLTTLVAENKISSRVAKNLLPEVVFDNVDPQQIAEERDLLQKNSVSDLLPIVQKIMVEHPSVVTDFKAGKEQALKFLVGQGMKATKGSADPQLLAETIKQQIL